MKRKNGFTLIELLVVIAIMMSILVIAIVNLSNVNKKKKEEAWAAVKEQIQTAATEYFTANEYLFEGLKEGSTGMISVGKLVKEDYLNKVTNPIDGKAVSYCAKVNVSKTGNKLSAEFDDSSIGETGTDCNTQSIVTVQEPGAPEISLSQSCTNNGNNGWCKGNEEVTLGITKKNGSIETKKYCQGDGYCDPGLTIPESNKMTDSNEGGSRVTRVAVKNQAGTTYAEAGYKIDKTAPTGNIVISKKDTWASANVYLAFSASDSGSGVGSFKIGSTNYFNGTAGQSSWTRNNASYTFSVTKYDGTSKTISDGVVYDVAGNQSPATSNNYTLYTDCLEANRVGTGSWANQAGAVCSNKCGGTIAQERGTKDKNSGNACPQKESQNGNCGGKKDGSAGAWVKSNCNKENKYTRRRTISLVSTIDSNHSCGSRTDGPYELSCSTSNLNCRITEIDNNCTSSSNNAIYGRLHVVCDRPVVRIKVHYYYQGGSSQVCHGVSASTAVNDIYGGEWTTGSSAKNSAYFNFRGCGSTKLRYKVIVTKLDGYENTWQASDGWYDFNFSTSGDSRSPCNPGAGGHWENW